MRTLLHSSAVLFFLITTLTATSQNDRFAYAVTSLNKEGANWNVLRRLDLQTGQYSTVLLDGTDQKRAVFSTATKKPFTPPTDAKYGNLLQLPFGNGVAAMAYDRRHQRLYYTPMYIDQLRYIDLTTMRLYYAADQSFTGLGNVQTDEGKIVTRMVIAPDGYGYAITNDGTSLIQFTTNKKLKITKLGSLVDDPANKGISIHNRCSSFGGDMVADDDGNLFIVSAANHVFKVNTQIKVATHMAAIEGLPKKFTSNGVVVDDNGNLLVSSAVYDGGYYVVNPKDWKAVPYAMTGTLFRSSDMANSNCLRTRSDQQEPIRITKTASLSDNINLYPNPVLNHRFTVQFSKIPSGDYALELVDANGHRLQQREISITAEMQTQELTIPSATAKGMYLLRVVDRSRQSVFQQKVLVQ